MPPSKDQDIAARGEGRGGPVDDQAVLGILGKMVKQRQGKRAGLRKKGGRLELAEKEREEIAIIEQFLPRQLSGDEVTGPSTRPSPKPAPRGCGTWGGSWRCSRPGIPARWISAPSARR